MKRILFITPTFARTGSEMVLWYLITNLDPQKYHIHLFSIKNGELLECLPSHINKTVAYKHSGKWHEKLFRGILKLCGVKNLIGYQLKQIQKRFEADLWFINTIVVPEAHQAAQEMDVTIATYFHEIDNAFGFINSDSFKKIMDCSHFCIACSEIVGRKISEFRPHNIRIQNSFINEEIIRTDRSRIELIKQKLGISSQDFVWVISGTATYMKGFDLLLPLMDYFKEKPVKIIWIGKYLENGLDFYVRSVAEKKYPGKLIFTGALAEDYYNYFAIANASLILSREECFPLVMLEAAYLKLPIVAFNSGTIDMFIEEGMGKVVDGLNLEALCKEMDWVHANQNSIDKNKLRQRALQFTVKNQIPLFNNLLLEILDHPSETV